VRNNGDRPARSIRTARDRFQIAIEGSLKAHNAALPVRELPEIRQSWVHADMPAPKSVSLDFRMKIEDELDESPLPALKKTAPANVYRWPLRNGSRSEFHPRRPAENPRLLDFWQFRIRRGRIVDPR
jgi:hypothetical protein